MAGVLVIGGSPSQRIRRLQERYDRVSRGMQKEEVLSIMIEEPTSTGGRGFSRAYWNDDPMSDAESERIQSVVSYSTETFFLPVTFEFTFDENNALVGKHRLD